jgi:hypothetical protein
MIDFFSQAFPCIYIIWVNAHGMSCIHTVCKCILCNNKKKSAVYRITCDEEVEVLCEEEEVECLPSRPL